MRLSIHDIVFIHHMYYFNNSVAWCAPMSHNGPCALFQDLETER